MASPATRWLRVLLSLVDSPLKRFCRDDQYLLLTLRVVLVIAGVAIAAVALVVLGRRAAEMLLAILPAAEFFCVAA